MWIIPPSHRGQRVPGHWPESRFVTSCHGPVSCLSSTDEFCPTPTTVPWVSTQTDEFRSSKIIRWQKFSRFEIRHRTFAWWNFQPKVVYPPIALSTFRWFRLSTSHGSATLPCDAVEPPTTRQIGDSPNFNWIVIGVWSVGYRKHHTLISGSSADDWSGSGQNLYEQGGSDQMSTITPVIILTPTY